MSKYRKGIIAAAGFLAVLAQVLSDGAVTAEELGLLVTTGAAAFGVYRVPNAT